MKSNERMVLKHEFAAKRGERGWKCLMFMVLLAGLSSPAATHYVVPPGTAGVTPTDPYTSWDTAGTNMIEVVKAALTNSTPRQVWVTNGVYHLTNTVAITDPLRLESVNGSASTILDGSYANGARGVNLSAQAYFQAQTVSGFKFRNFTVTNGHAAALYCSSDRTTLLTLEDCIFENNRHFYSSGLGGTGWGGAAFVSLSRGVAPLPKLVVSNCVFRGNTCRNGGSGMYLYGVFGGATITDSLFDRNTNTIYGGGAVYFNSGSAARDLSTIRNCQFLDNISGQQGGAIFAAGAVTDLLIENCQIEGNEARSDAHWANASQGGGLFLGGLRSTVRNCRILDNFTTKQGGGVYAPYAELVNCLVAENRVTDATEGTGGGVYLSTSGALNNCTIAGNSASVSAGGLYIAGTGSATNCIVYHNTAPTGTNYANAAGDTGLSYCCVTPPAAGVGNLDADPLFKNAAGGDYRLLGSSPCVNAGTNLSWMADAVDLDGNPRVDLAFDRVDLGCYERVFHRTMIVIR